MTKSHTRVGVFSYDFLPFLGGGGRHAFEIVKRLPPDSFVVFSGRCNQLPGHHAILSSLRHGSFKQLLVSVWLNLRIRSIVRTHGLARINVNVGPGGIVLVRKAGVPLVATVYHTYWQQSRLRFQFWKSWLVPFERTILRSAQSIICISEDTRRVVVDRYGIPRCRTRVIPPGVDPAVFHPVPSIARTPKHLLFLGRLERRKGIDFLVRSMCRVAMEDPDVVLYVGGHGRLLRALTRFVTTNGLERNVRFLGRLDDSELNEWYNRVGAVVMPSVLEGFGIPVIEAMATGTPVVGTDVDGIRSLIDDGKTGLLVPYGDEEALAAAILRAARGELSTPSDLSETVRTVYDWETVTEEYSGVLFGESEAASYRVSSRE